MRTRRDVWKLAGDPTDKTLYWYSVAVKNMQARFFDKPLSWKFQAAVHGYDASLYPPLRAGESLPSAAIQGTYWDQCEHASWYFLPWHRIFIFLFEQICRDVILENNGPEEWALPYWDYSHPSTAKQRSLPDAFRDALVSGGAPNPLYADRGPGVNTGGVVGTDRQSENKTCLKSRVFSGTVPSGFGGGASTPMQFSSYTGNCENVPHNAMHDAIGGLTGWMDNPLSAALDPIFWLHHANIDRLWVIWEKDPTHTPPPDAAWNNQTFDFFDPRGNPKKYAVRDVLHTTGPLCDYVYEDIINPLTLPAAAVGTTSSGKPLDTMAMKAMRKSQMIGASTEPSVTLGDGVASVSFALHPPAPISDIGKRVLSQAGTEVEPRVHLALENVTAREKPIHTYEVYVNVPEGEPPRNHPELFAGLITRFGLVEASRAKGKHGDQGVNLSFDITDIVSHLRRAKSWNPDSVRVTFAPHDGHEDTSLASERRPVPERRPVTVGRVSVYTQLGV